MTTFAPSSRSIGQHTLAPTPAFSQRSNNSKTFLDIMQLLAQVGDCIQAGQEKSQATALLQQTVALLSTLSVAILVPSEPALALPASKSNKVTYAINDDEEEYDGSSFVSLSLSQNGSTHSSPPRASYTAPLPTSHHQFNVRVPGTPTHQTRLQPPAELLTPPPSNQKAQTWTAPGAAFTERIRSSQNGGSDRSSLPSPTGSPVNEPRTGAFAGGAGASFGFQSSSNPQTSDADFQKRATHHRVQGRGDPKLYEQTLQLTGATTIDGHTIQFKITDAYWNPESYNYSESLCRLDGSGITGYRYDNRNGSTYIRFDEPTGPRICFVRHAHPPFVINSSAPPASHGYISQSTPALMSIKMMKPISRQGSFRGGSLEGNFSVQDFWN